MTLAQKIQQKVEKLPEAIQAEILDFVDFIDQKKGHASDADWQTLSLSAAMRGMEAETSPEYTNNDLKERFQ